MNNIIMLLGTLSDSKERKKSVDVRSWNTDKQAGCNEEPAYSYLWVLVFPDDGSWRGIKIPRVLKEG